MRPFNKTTATLVRTHPFSTLCPTPLGKSPVCILLDCLHDALHGAGLDNDDEVSQLKGEQLRFQHLLLLLDLLDFNLLQTDAVHA